MDMTKYTCTRCDKNFSDSTGLYRHLTQRKKKCDETFNQEFWLQKQLLTLGRRFEKLKAIARLGDEIMSMDEKKRVLISFYKKCNDLLYVFETKIDKDKQPLFKDGLENLKIYMKACEDGI